jgi:hypothetical protein
MPMDRLGYHPLADLFPLMSDEEVNDLGEDMLIHGQRKRIMLFEGMILDGRNRYNACLLKGIEPRFVDYHGPDPLGLVISLNLKRRHLDDAQRSMVAARLATMKQGARTDLSPNGGISQAKAAELLNVKKRRVERAREVVDHGVPDLVTAVERGEVPVAPAAEFAKATPPLDQQRQIVEAGSAAAAVKASRADVKAKADRAAAKVPKPMPDVTAAADRAEAKAHLASQRRFIAQGVMGTLDFFEHGNVEPTERAEKIIEHFDRSIAETIGPREFSVTRVRRAIQAMTIVFAAITAPVDTSDADGGAR